MILHKSVIYTHTLIWFVEDDPKLGANAGMILEDPHAGLVLPLIALAEAAFIVESGRKTSIPSVDDLMNDVLADSRIEIYPLTYEVFQQSLTLTSIPGNS